MKPQRNTKCDTVECDDRFHSRRSSVVCASRRETQNATPLNLTIDSTPVVDFYLQSNMESIPLKKKYMESIHVPDELEDDILSRLPVKTLSRFKCACKRWRDLIESPSFVKRHFERETNQERLLVKLDKLDADGCHTLFLDGTFLEYEEPDHVQIPDAAWDIFGPVFGVFCVVTERTWGPMALLNPALRQFKPLPLVQPINPPSMNFSRGEFGFGYDPSTGEHKLVLLMYFSNRTNRRCVVYVCSSNSDSWRMLEGVDPIVSNRFVDRSRGNTYLNGVYYWLFHFTGAANDASILAFDMSTEKFREIIVTGCVPGSRMGYLAICGDRLTVLMHDTDEIYAHEIDEDEDDWCFDVWTMKEGCWAISSKVGTETDEDLSGSVAICFWKKSGLLLETMSTYLALCDVNTQKLRAIDAQPTDDDGCACAYWVFVYKESLVSLKGGAGKCYLWDTSSNSVKEFFRDSSSQRFQGTTIT